MDASDVVTLVAAIVGALIAAAATIYTTGRASSRRRAKGEHLEALERLRGTVEELIKSGVGYGPGVKDTRRMRYDHNVSQMLSLDNYQPLREALDKFEIALDHLPSSAEARNAVENADLSYARLVRSGSTVERVTRAMAKNYGRTLKKPDQPWGMGKGEHLEALEVLRHSVEMIITSASDADFRSGSLGLLGAWILDLDNNQPLREALDELRMAVDHLAEARNRGENADLSYARLVRSGSTVERVTRAMAKNYGRKLKKPGQPWGTGVSRLA